MWQSDNEMISLLNKLLVVQVSDTTEDQKRDKAKFIENIIELSHYQIIELIC